MSLAHEPHSKEGWKPEWSVGCSAYCCEVVESADIYVCVGGIFNDYSSAGYSMLLKRNKMINVRF